jgi:broad-specificity NMP kinase
MEANSALSFFFQKITFMTVARLPNILLTGTPGTGKTTTASMLASALNYSHIDVSALVKENSLHEGFDEEYQSFIINEDLVVDHMEELMLQGGNVVDHHSPGFFPERWFDLIVCLQCDNTILYDRLQARGYPQHKIEENVQCEIMQVVLEETRESYQQDRIVVLMSNSSDELESNVERLEETINQMVA